MARRKAKRRRSSSEKIMIVLGVIIALSMLFSLFVGLGRGGSSSSNAPLPESERFEAPAEPLGAIEGDTSPLALAGPAATGPPAS